MNNFLKDPRFEGIEPFEKKIWLSSPTMHGEELQFMKEAYETNWMSTVGENINEVERITCEKVGAGHAVALSSGTAALHLAIKLAGERLYGKPSDGKGTLFGKRVFCSDVTFAATVNPIYYEGGTPVFIDSEYDTWNMDPEALNSAFEEYPMVRIVVLVHLYGTPAKVDEIRHICKKNGALLIEDAAESLGASYKGRQTGMLGDYGVISFNGNKIITGSSGGMLLVNDEEEANKARKWSTQSRENAPWYQHAELGYNYRMSNVIAGVVRGQYLHLEEHIAQKKEIYERYKEGFKDLPIQMNPFDSSVCEPNYWLSCMIIDEEAMCPQERGATEAFYKTLPGKSCPTEILEALAAFNAEGRPIWKPMYMQPVFHNSFIMRPFMSFASDSIYVSEDLFERGLCLPSDNKTTIEQVDKAVEIVHRCFE